jgi:hypothetical protein
MGREIAFHVFTTHTAGFDDGSPMQLVSAERLAYHRLCEAAAGALGGVVLGGLVAVLIFVARICQ